MAEILVPVPEGLEREVKQLSKEELEKSIVEFIRLKVFELELKRSRELQKAVFKVLASKSKLTEKNASELGRKISEGMLEELKEKGLV